MKRMIDYKEFKELQQLANNNEQRLDDLEDVFTYSNLAVDDVDFDFIDPASPENFQPVSLAIGDHVYIDGEQTDLTAEMIADIYDSNLVVLSCGSAPTTYPNIILQRQFIDPASGALSPKSARFEAFVTLDSTVYNYTMIVTKYDSTSEEGGSIVISCKEAAVKPLYYHPITCWDNQLGSLSFLIVDNNPEPYTSITLLDKISGFARLAPITGALNVNSQTLIISYAYKSNNVFYAMGVYTNGNIESGQTSISINSFIANAANLSDGVNKLN